MLALVVVIAAGLAATWYLIGHRSSPEQLPNEPPLVRSRIPYVGHILDLLQHGTKYLDNTSARSPSPIYTLQMLNGKVYVVTSPELMTAVNRNARVLAFNPFIAALGKRITGHDRAMSIIIHENLNGEDGPGYVTDIHDNHVVALGDPKNVQNLLSDILDCMQVHLDRLAQEEETNLFAWVRHSLTRSMTTAVYGPRNPLANDQERLDECFWVFNASLNRLMLDVWPSLTAAKGHEAREKLAVAFQEYYRNYLPGRDKSSALTLSRHLVNKKYFLTYGNTGRMEIGALFGVLANITSTVFYTLMHILSDKELLQRIRVGLEKRAVARSSDGLTQSLKVMSMRNDCHLLHATMKEVLRHHARGSSVRLVREDTLLDDKYLLRKGMVVQMPMSVIHGSRQAWGEDASSFRPERFMADISKEGFMNSKQTNPGHAFRPFGGGASLCPGRHVAILETMAAAALMVLRFDISPADGGLWRIPEPKQDSLATNVFPPEKDVRVKVESRADTLGVKWKFVMD